MLRCGCMRHGTILRAPLRPSSFLLSGTSTHKTKKKKVKKVKQTAEPTPLSSQTTQSVPSTRSCHSNMFTSKTEMERFLLRRLANPMTGSLLPQPYAPHTSIIEGTISLPSQECGIYMPDDVRMHRRLNNRFMSAVDQEKEHGTAEVAFHTLHDDVSKRLQWAREALRHLLLLSSGSGSGSCTAPCAPNEKAITVPRRVVVLVLYSHTRHSAAVGRHMRGIRDTVRAMLAERHEDVLGVLTVAVGVKWRDLAPETSPEGDGNEEGRRTRTTSGNDDVEEEEEDVLWYPNAGMYTLNALVQCLCRVAVDEGKGELALHRKIMIVSDGWFHVRTIAELHKQDSYAVLEGDTVDVEPLPFVLGSSHSVEEVEEFARFTACRAIAD